MYHFPKRPIDRTGFYRHRSWNGDIPYYDSVVCHACADQCFADGLDFTAPCSNGDLIAAVRNLSSYPGMDFIPYNAGQTHTYVVDSGFPSVFTGSASATPYNTGKFLYTPGTAAFTVVFSVFRAAGTAWGNYGAPFGRYNYRPYLFSNSNTTWTQAPVLVQRQNGNAMALGAALSSVNNPMVLTIGATSPATVSNLTLATQVDNSTIYSAGLYVYEAIAYAGSLTTDQMAEIEAYLMDKYGIA